MSFTFCSSGAIVRKAGANVNSNIAASAAFLQQVSDEIEGQINLNSRYDLVAGYSGLNTNTKLALGEIESNLGGVYLIAYDMSGYTGRGEAEDMIIVLRDSALRILTQLKDKNYLDFLKTGA